MNPMFISTIVGLAIAVMTLGQVSTSVSQAIFTKNVETSISREGMLAQQIQQYRTNEGSYPSTVADLVSKGYWQAADNTNGFGGTYTFSVDAVRGRVVISTTIADAARRAQYMGSFHHTFKPVHAGSGVLTMAFVMPTKGSGGIPAPEAGIPVSATAPNPATTSFWYDTSSGAAILKVSNGTAWLPANVGSSGLAAPSAANTVNSLSQLPASASVGDVRYVLNPTTGTLATYVYYNGGWVYTGGGGGFSVASYTVKNSLRLKSGSYLSRTPAAPGNAQNWTWSGWVKRGSLGSAAVMLGAGPTLANRSLLMFNAESIQYVESIGGANYGFVTPAKFRDTSSWYHVVFALDTTKPGAGQYSLYVNGVAQPLGAPTYMPLMTSVQVNRVVPHTMGRDSYDTLGSFGGFIAEVNFVDGQTLTANEFGATDPEGTGKWVPKKYMGTHGGNGFYLDFSDGSGLAALGADRSGRGNPSILNNVSLAAGHEYDWLIDSPTKNFAVLNGLDATEIGVSVRDEGLRIDTSVAGFGGPNATIGVTSGKWYWEVTQGSSTTTALFGIRNSSASLLQWPGGASGGGYGYYQLTGAKYVNAGGAAYGAPWGLNDVIGVALDLDARTLAFFKNGVSQGIAFTAIPPGVWFPAAGDGSSAEAAALLFNFGQRPFVHSPPAGFNSLNASAVTDVQPLTSGTFIGNLSAEGPFVWANGTPESLTINGNAVAFGLQADRLANGFKIRSNNATFNATSTNSWVASYKTPASNSSFKQQLAK
jgi:hypothetical protein